MCPLCHKYASLTTKGRLYQHKGDNRILVSGNFMECRASGYSLPLAETMRKNKDAGRHPYRYEDGTWIGATPRP